MIPTDFKTSFLLLQDFREELLPAGVFVGPIQTLQDWWYITTAITFLSSGDENEGYTNLDKVTEAANP